MLFNPHIKSLKYTLLYPSFKYGSMRHREIQYLPINTKVIIAEYGLEAKDNVLNYYPVFPQVDFKQADMPKHEDPQ